MNARVLGAWHVAVMLVAASYGIGFLFGSGEAALTQGMAGALYGVATAAGMLALAFFARRLWAAGVPVWQMFGEAFGPRASSMVALLSLVWMSGVLAAQLHGGQAVLALLGFAAPWDFVFVLVLMFAASRMNLRVAATLFSACLLLSAAVLLFALASTGGGEVLLRAPSLLASDLAHVDALRLLSAALAVSVLVCLGADYHQFIVAARTARVAALGCLAAGVVLMLLAFLPPAIVIAMQEAGRLDGLADPKQVVPFVLARVSERIGPGADRLMLAALMLAALGSGAAILRAMTSALASAAGRTGTRQSPSDMRWSAMALAIGAALALRGQGIVETMVSVNLIYIASVAVPFVALAVGWTLPHRRAMCSMVAGLSGSSLTYVAGWLGWVHEHPDALSLAIGIVAAVAVALRCRVPRRAGASATGQ